MSRSSATQRRWQGVRTAVANRVELHTRTLAAFRVALGVLLLADLLLRARNLVAFYTDRGVLPVATLTDLFPAYRFLSLHALSGSVALQAALFLLAAVAAVALVVGYRTRTATVLSLLLLVSLQARNPMVLNGGDPLLRRLLFWSVFLPLGARWSVDGRHGRSKPGGSGNDTTQQRGPRRTTVASVASAGLLLQVVFVYLANLGFKLQGSAWPSGDAVEQALALDAFSILLGDLLGEFPALLSGISWIWLVLLACSPLLLLATGRTRAILAAAFAAMHVGMGLTMQLGLFPAISVVALLPFFGPVVDDVALPAAIDHALDRLAAVLPPGPRSVVPDAVGRGLRRATAAFLLAVLVGMVVLNAVALGVLSPPARTPDAVADRSWDMFGPTPPQHDVGFVATATLESGRTVDVLERTGIRHGSLAAPGYATARWHKYLNSLREAPATARRGLATSLCDRWNARRDDGPVRVRLGVVLTPAADDSMATARRVDLGTFACRGG